MSAIAGVGSGKWFPSLVPEEWLDGLAREGVLPLQEHTAWRAPIKEKEPDPHPHEWVLLAPFVERGLSLPLHDFVRGLFFIYEIQLHYLNPNGLLHTACFITLCECSLGTRPHFGL